MLVRAKEGISPQYLRKDRSDSLQLSMEVGSNFLFCDLDCVVYDLWKVHKVRNEMKIEGVLTR